MKSIIRIILYCQAATILFLVIAAVIRTFMERRNRRAFQESVLRKEAEDTTAPRD